MDNKGLEALAALAAADSSSNPAQPLQLQQPSDSQQLAHTTPSTPGRSAGGPDIGGHPSAAAGGVASYVNASAMHNPLAQLANASVLQSASNNYSLTAQQATQLQQAFASTASSLNPAAYISMLTGLQQMQQPPQADANALLAVQQLAYYHYLLQGQNHGAGASPAVHPSPGPTIASVAHSLSSLFEANPALSLAWTGQTQSSRAPKSDEGHTQSNGAQVLPTVYSKSSSTTPAASVPVPSTSFATSSLSSFTNSSNTSINSNIMPPPQPIAAQPFSVSTAGIPSLPPTTFKASPAIASASSKKANHSSIVPHASRHQQQQSQQPSQDSLHEYEDASGYSMPDKKLQKRAANRRSAQLSRKRKKLFIEELKDENDDLRRKEQILKSIPDLIVVFDSSGKLWFVSQSASRFLQFHSSELEGTSFWDRLCEDSVRLLKAAFMDSLAARQAESDTAPLGSGLWELRLVDKDGTQRVVTLNGVVHFAGERPECVCSIRPRQESSMSGVAAAHGVTSATSEVKGSVKDTASITSPYYQPLLYVKPQQSVVNNVSCSSSNSNRSSGSNNHLHSNSSSSGSGSDGDGGGNGSGGGVVKQRSVSRGVVRISDSGNSSGDSESGSSDELNATS